MQHKLCRFYFINKLWFNKKGLDITQDLENYYFFLSGVLLFESNPAIAL